MATQINPNLSDEQKHVLFNKGTEAPGTNDQLFGEADGMYTCVNCGQPLFSSTSKYDSRIPGLIGWPSFAEAAADGAVDLVPDDSLGMHRTEVICKNCGAHLGHVFEGDSDSPTGKHYCINSVCLGFKKEA